MQQSVPIDHSFHSFCITSQSGQRIYGGSYVFSAEHSISGDDQSGEHQTIYTTRALVALTVRPVVDQLHRCLEWCVRSANCNHRWLSCVAQIRLPPKGKCLKINLPNISRKRSQEVKNRHNESQVNNNEELSNTGPNSDQSSTEMTIFRPLSVLPLFDYPLRRLFTQVLSVEQFLLCYSCALMETQILIVSTDFYTLMLVAESLTQLLNPFKWQHVYVPILPNKLGTLQYRVSQKCVYSSTGV